MSEIVLAKRAQSLKGSPTLALGAKAKALAQKGHDVISLSLGEPDWDTFQSAKDAAIEAIRQGYTKYTPANGIPELRELVATQTSAETGVTYSADQVTVATGGKFVLFAAFQALINPGDEVLIPAPYWVSYPVMVELAEGRPVIVPTTSETRFKVTGADLKKALTPRSRVLVLNSPSNPTGEVYSRKELEEIAQVIKENPNLLVMSDDIYNRLCFEEGGLAPHLLQVAPELSNRVIIVNGASKTYSMTGWRIGWAVGPKNVITAMTHYQSQSVSCPNSIAQKATLAALQEPPTSLRQVVERLKVRRDKAYEALTQVHSVSLSLPKGAFYLWVDVSEFLGRTYGSRKLSTSSDFSEVFLEQYFVATVPGIEFGSEGYLRMSYVLSEERMKEAVTRLKQMVSQLK